MMDELHMPHLVCGSNSLQNVYPRNTKFMGRLKPNWTTIKMRDENYRNMYHIILLFLQDANPLSYANW